MAKVLVLLADGFEEIEAVSIVDVLRRGNVKVVLAAILKKNVLGAGGLKIVADTHIDDIDILDFDMVVLPGGNLGYKNLADSEKVIKIVQEFDKSKKLIGAICASTFVLSKAEVLKNVYTCYPSMEIEIGKPGYVSDKNVVIDDNIFTSRGPATAIEFSLAILERLQGEGIANSIRAKLLA